MSKRTDRITHKLALTGAAWATSATKHIHPDDPLEDQAAQRKTWHIHPDAAEPRSEYVQRFDTLDELDEWLDFCHCPEDMATSSFSDDGLLEWCDNCGKLVRDHHQRKFGTPHPNL